MKISQKTQPIRHQFVSLYLWSLVLIQKPLATHEKILKQMWNISRKTNGERRYLKIIELPTVSILGFQTFGVEETDRRHPHSHAPIFKEYRLECRNGGFSISHQVQ